MEGIMKHQESNSFVRYLIIVGLIVIGLEVPIKSVSANSKNWKDCESREPDRMIRGCSPIIKAGKDTRKNLAIAYNNRGIAYREKGEYDRAIADFTQAIKLNPKDVNPYLNRGVAYEKKREYDLAIADYTQAIKLNSKYAYPYNNLAWTYYKSDRPAEGLPHVLKFLELDGISYAAWDTLGAIQEALGNKEDAIEAYKKAMELDPKHETSKEHLVRLGAL